MKFPLAMFLSGYAPAALLGIGLQILLEAINPNPCRFQVVNLFLLPMIMVIGGLFLSSLPKVQQAGRAPMMWGIILAGFMPVMMVAVYKMGLLKPMCTPAKQSLMFILGIHV